MKNGHCTAEEAEKRTPPTRRPIAGEDWAEWTLWRMFAVDAMSDFLNTTADTSKAVAPRVASMTCVTPNMLEFDNCIKGCDYFEVAKGMDVLGLTLYKNVNSGDYYTTSMLLSCAESAAAAYGKHYWLIELDNATNIPGIHFNRESYLSVGSGAKGIVYYQWRGDYPFEGAPEPNGFGFLNSDGSKAPNYDNGVKMIALLNRLSDELVSAEKMRSGAAILYSHHAAMMADALDNGFQKEVGIWQNTVVERIRRYYYELHREGMPVDIVETRTLKENPLGIRAVFVPVYAFLSEQEKADLDAFAAAGGKVFLQATDRWQPGLVKNGFEELHAPKGKFDACWLTSEALTYAGIVPVATLSTPLLGLELLENSGAYIASVINLSKLTDTVSGATLRLGRDISAAEFYTPDGMQELKISDGLVFLPDVTDGGLLILRKA